MFKKIFIGIGRHPKRFLLAIGFGYATIWTVLEPFLSLVNLKTTGYNGTYLVAYLLASIIIGVIVVCPKRKVRFPLKNTNTRIEIEFGDLFVADGNKAIPVSEFFDSKIGKPVSPRSLHGVFIEKILGGQTKIIDDAVNAQLSGLLIDNVQRSDGKTAKYEIGSTITIEHNKSKYFLFALSHTDIDCNAYSTPSIMLKALDCLWNKVRTEGNGDDLNLPLVGNGLSRIGIPPSQLLQLTLISLLKAAKERDLCSTVRVILTTEIFDNIDLEIIKKNWQ